VASLRGTLVLILAVAGTIAGAEVPRLLILQLPVPPASDGTDLNVALADALAHEFDQAGKVSSVVWGMTDPFFRNAVLEGRLTDVVEKPQTRDAVTAARRLAIEYVLTCEAKQSGLEIQAKVQLLRGGRVLWKDEEKMRVEGTRTEDMFNVTRSLARTFAYKANAEPLKGLTVATQAPELEPTKGDAPPVIPVPKVDPVIPTAPPEDVVPALREEVRTMVAEGRQAAAILKLRDTVDQRPLDVACRTLLIETLMASDPEAAAREARRATAVAPESAELRVLSARAWMETGKTAEAQADLNEALARDPESAPVRLMLAEIALGKGEVESALAHVDATIAAGPTAEAHHLRALIRAVLGGADGVAADLQAAQALAPETSPPDALRRYRLATTVLDMAFDGLAKEVRDALPRAAVRPQDPEVAAVVENLGVVLTAHEALMVGQLVPSDARTAHERRLLARKLLVQSVMDLGAYVKGAKEAIGDARINLGDAVRQMATAREAWSPSNGTAPRA
jgi:tetratricopeptide (TPR) repeat protein